MARIVEPFAWHLYAHAIGVPEQLNELLPRCICLQLLDLYYQWSPALALLKSIYELCQRGSMEPWSASYMQGLQL